jgi:palmitoyl-protein thioesterase
LWHGLLANPSSDFNYFKKMLKEANVSVKSVDLTVNNLHEQEASVFVHPNAQIEQVCDEIKRDEELKDGFNAIGLSQGGQFMWAIIRFSRKKIATWSLLFRRRGLIQRCEAAKVRNFISLGGQHQGIYGLPNCPLSDSIMSPCNLLRKLLNLFAYTDWAQSHIAQATYWHDPINVRQYQKLSTFLADINNERDINADYIRRLQRLDKFVLVKFLRDEMVQPIETQWFGFYRPGSDKRVLNMTETETYRRDKLGLRRMMANGQLVFHAIDDEHLNVPSAWFKENIMPLLIDN